MASRKGRHEGAPIYGVSAEFTSAQALLDGVRRLRPYNLGRMDTFTPVPVAGMSEALGVTGSLRIWAVLATVGGFVAAMGLWIYSEYEYVLDVGGRPVVSWPSLMVPSTSFAMLTGALGTLLAMLYANRLPQLNHPAFNVPNFTRVTQDHYVLIVSPFDDEELDLAALDRAFAALPQRPATVAQVPR